MYNLDRPLPRHVASSTVPPAYARLIAHGYDTVAETFLWRLSPGADKLLDDVKQAAREQSEEDDGRTSFGFAGQRVQMHAFAPRGCSWLFSDDDMSFEIRRGGAGTCTVRYRSAGLWEHGLDKLREEAAGSLLAAGRPTRHDWRRITRADYAFDFWSPSFSAEMVPGIGSRVVAHAETKLTTTRKLAPVEVDEIGKAAGIEYLRIGGASSQWLQVVVYDKLKEITEASGKTWMLKLWEREGYLPPDGPADVWRLEARFFKEFLRERRIISVDDFQRERGKLISEALYSRRLTEATADSNRRRWPLHPLWALAQRAAGGGAMLPLGRRTTGARAAIVDQLHKQVAGTLVAGIVAADGDFALSSLPAVLERIEEIIRYDPGQKRKVERSQERYSLLDEAR